MLMPPGSSGRFGPTIASLIAAVLIALFIQSVQAETTPADASDATIVLQVQPRTCVALHKGQVCYQTLTISWPNLDADRYCLHSSLQATPLVCWKQNERISYAHKYASAINETFYLKHPDDESVLARVLVSTSWVYRTGRRSSSGWRLF
jgi:hypothetical protein